MAIKSFVITISDRASQGVYKDESGEVLTTLLKENDIYPIDKIIIPDDKHTIVKNLKKLCKKHSDIALVVTTGGTGITTRDVTPEATLKVIKKRILGIEELIRAKSQEITPSGCITRGVCGVRNNTIILNLPGSLKAVKETLQIALSPLKHALKMIATDGKH